MIAQPGDQCWQSEDDADPVNQTHGLADPSNAVLHHEKLSTIIRNIINISITIITIPDYVYSLTL